MAHDTTEKQVKILAIGMGLLTQFAAIVYLFATLQTDVKRIGEEQFRRQPLVERFLSLEQRVVDLDRRTSNLEARLNSRRLGAEAGGR